MSALYIVDLTDDSLDRLEPESGHRPLLHVSATPIPPEAQDIRVFKHSSLPYPIISDDNEQKQRRTKIAVESFSASRPANANHQPAHPHNLFTLNPSQNILPRVPPFGNRGSDEIIILDNPSTVKEDGQCRRSNSASSSDSASLEKTSPDFENVYKNLSPSKRRCGSLDRGRDAIRKKVHRNKLSIGALSRMVDVEEKMIDLTMNDNSPERASGNSQRKPDDVGLDVDVLVAPEGDSMHGVITEDDWLTDEQIEARLAALTFNPEVPPTKSSPAEHTWHGKVELKECEHEGVIYKVGDGAELDDGSFLRIERILLDDDAVFFSGIHLMRSDPSELLMPRRSNELVCIVEMTVDELRSGIKSKKKEVRETDLIKRRSITFTNRQWPDMSFIAPSRSENLTDSLFCRWKLVKILTSKGKIYEQSLHHLQLPEADAKASIDPSALRELWRGGQTMPGGSYIGTSRNIINLADDDSRVSQKRTQRYTFGDCFCGAGGASRSASLAGLEISWGFDQSMEAMRAYRDNFQRSGTECYETDVYQFLTFRSSDHVMVDVLHISPPCQPFSPAHTIPSPERDEANQATLLSVPDLIAKVKPRIVVLEETAGLLQRHLQWFRSLIRNFVNLGYSVRWKVVNCEEYGIPQKRQRLVVIASG